MKSTVTPRKSLALFMALLFCVACLLPGCSSSSSEDPVLTKKDVSLYVDQKEETLPLAFADSEQQIPLVCIHDAVALLENYVQEHRDEKYTLKADTDGDTITLTRDNGAQCVLDYANGTLTFPDYNAFHRFSFELGSLDILESTGFDEAKKPAYFHRVLCSEKAAQTSVVDLRARDIPFYMQAGKGYVTLQTFSDLFLTPYEIMLSYNQKSAFLLTGDLLGDLSATYYGAKELKPSQELLALNYRQLCLLIDFHYGLQEEHNISSADAYIAQVGLKDALLSDDQTVRFSALKTLFYKYLSDNHSGVLMHPVFLAEPDYNLGAQEASIGHWEFYNNYQLYQSGRKEQFGDKPKPYEEIGDTAFVTFDSFSSATQNYYEKAPTKDNLKDEVGLISYAHAQITRKNSPIKNVVIDLATNTGGHMDGGIFLTSWVLGNAILHISDPVRQAEGTYIYRADVNLDRVFDSKDTIADKNVYLIVSPITFSCANYVANAFKESGKVTLLGTTSGGGTACVYMGSTLDGAGVNFSASLRMSAYKNGSYYSLDTGVVPDIKFTSLADFFDRKRIKEIIDNQP